MKKDAPHRTGAGTKTGTGVKCAAKAGNAGPGRLAAASMVVLAALGLGLGCNGCNRNGATDTVANADSSATPPLEAAARHEIDLFAFGRQLGTIAPCGCTTDPLGGLQFAFGYIEAESSAGQRLILEPGSFLFPDPDGPEGPADEAAWAQAGQRAELLHQRFATVDGLVSGLGPTDYASAESSAALEHFALPRVIANVAADARPPGASSHRSVSLGHGITAAVTQVVDPDLAERARGQDWGKDFPEIEDPVAALKALWPELSKAQLQVVMVHGPRALAESVAREVDGVDVVVIGGEFSNADQARLGSAPVKVGSAWVLEPGDRAQTISHMTLSIALDGDGDALEDGQLAEEWIVVPTQTQREAELARLEDKIAKFAADPSADPSFLARLEAERDGLKAALAGPAIPKEAAVALLTEQTKVTCRLPDDEAAAAALRDYDAAVAKTNRERFAGVHAPTPEPGAAAYVGVEACADCHEEAVAQWKTTVHARAYETLAVANKQYDLSCVGCHVTGFRQPGGSEVVENEGLQAVQCEQCHGPGSLHVEDPATDNIRLVPPVSVCGSCHTAEHSDTFEHSAYLRDVLGPGHGVDARAKLGDGPTGRELRAAGVAAAGGSCKKM